MVTQILARSITHLSADKEWKARIPTLACTFGFRNAVGTYVANCEWLTGNLLEFFRQVDSFKYVSRLKLEGNAIDDIAVVCTLTALRFVVSIEIRNCSNVTDQICDFLANSVTCDNISIAKSCGNVGDASRVKLMRTHPSPRVRASVANQVAESLEHLFCSFLGSDAFTTDSAADFSDDEARLEYADDADELITTGIVTLILDTLDGKSFQPVVWAHFTKVLAFLVPRLPVNDVLPILQRCPELLDFDDVAFRKACLLLLRNALKKPDCVTDRRNTIVTAMTDLHLHDVVSEVIMGTEDVQCSGEAAAVLAMLFHHIDDMPNKRLDDLLAVFDTLIPAAVARARVLAFTPSLYKQRRVKKELNDLFELIYYAHRSDDRRHVLAPLEFLTEFLARNLPLVHRDEWGEGEGTRLLNLTYPRVLRNIAYLSAFKKGDRESVVDVNSKTANDADLHQLYRPILSILRVPNALNAIDRHLLSKVTEDASFALLRGIEPVAMMLSAAVKLERELKTRTDAARAKATKSSRRRGRKTQNDDDDGNDDATAVPPQFQTQVLDFLVSKEGMINELYDDVKNMDEVLEYDAPDLDDFGSVRFEWDWDGELVVTVVAGTLTKLDNLYTAIDPSGRLERRAERRAHNRHAEDCCECEWQHNTSSEDEDEEEHDDDDDELECDGE